MCFVTGTATQRESTCLACEFKPQLALGLGAVKGTKSWEENSLLCRF